MKSDAITVVCVPPTHFARILPHCADTIERGLQLSDDMGTMSTVIERIERAEMLVWLVTDGREPLATCFTDIKTADDGGRFVCVHGLAGKHITKWARQLSDRLAAFAREEQCARVMFAGRPGWAKLLPEFQQVRRLGAEYVWERAIAH